MENDRKYDQDEILIINALNSVHTQDFDILKGIEGKMKPRRIKKKSLFIILAAAFLISSTVMAAQYFGSFDRLRGIVGDEYADILIPIEIATEDPDQEVLYDGIRVELVAANVSDNVVNVYFTLEDTTANRLNGEFDIDNGLFLANELANRNRDRNSREGIIRTSSRTEIIDRDNSGIVTVHARHEFGQSVEGLEFVFMLMAIYFDVHDEQHMPIDVDLSEFLANDSYMLYQYEYPNPWGTAIQILIDPPKLENGEQRVRDGERGGFDWEYIENLRTKYTEKIRQEGLPVLTPNNVDIGLNKFFPNADARASISAIGVIDGRLHVQLAHPQTRLLNEAGWEGFSRLALFRGSMEELQAHLAYRQAQFDAGYMPWELELHELWDNTVRPYMTVYFYTDSEGVPFFANKSEVDAEGVVHMIYDPRIATSSRYDEHIFDIDIENINNYVLIAHTFSQQTLPVGWSVPFDMD